jgi:hypothetical protein
MRVKLNDEKRGEGNRVPSLPEGKRVNPYLVSRQAKEAAFIYMTYTQQVVPIVAPAHAKKKPEKARGNK